MQCHVCEVEEERLKPVKWANISQPTCSTCLYVWYDQGLTNPEQIKEASLKKRAKSWTGSRQRMEQQ